ncbi:MAG: hypothetical protein OEN51_12670, partial [Gammaproteobacteria bacterium]|nr:hypothetical protein [Gammaproteobacteria bacterium]
MNSRLTAPLLLATTLILAGCPGMPSTELPLRGIETANVAARNDTLVIMLPGRGDRADVFIEEGFPATGARLGFDTIAVNAHFGYYRERSLVDRLHQDI